MKRDAMTEAYDEWYVDAVRDVYRMPNRFESFKAGWEAAMEYYECEAKEYTPEELRISRGGT